MQHTEQLHCIMLKNKLLKIPDLLGEQPFLFVTPPCCLLPLV